MRPDPGWRETIQLIHTSLWCLKRFSEGLKGLHKAFWDTRRKFENKNLSEFFFLIQLSEMYGTARVNTFPSRKHTSYWLTSNVSRYTRIFTKPKTSTKYLIIFDFRFSNSWLETSWPLKSLFYDFQRILILIFLLGHQERLKQSCIYDKIHSL